MNLACYTFPFKQSRAFSIKIHTVSVSFLCLATALLSASWHRRLWWDPASVSSQQHFQNGKDFEACLPQQKHRYTLKGEEECVCVCMWYKQHISQSTIICNGKQKQQQQQGKQNPALQRHYQPNPGIIAFSCEQMQARNKLKLKRRPSNFLIIKSVRYKGDQRIYTRQKGKD